jgi:hypothetical protein
MRTRRFRAYGNGSYSRSLNAESAEADGRMPMTRAIPVVAQAAGITQAEARRALVASHDGEWHHVSKFANRVDYYDINAAIAAAVGPERWAEMCTAQERADQQARLAELRRLIEVWKAADAAADIPLWQFAIPTSSYKAPKLIDLPRAEVQHMADAVRQSKNVAEFHALMGYGLGDFAKDAPVILQAAEEDWCLERREEIVAAHVAQMVAERETRRANKVAAAEAEIAELERKLS